MVFLLFADERLDLSLGVSNTIRWGGESRQPQHIVESVVHELGVSCG